MNIIERGRPAKYKIKSKRTKMFFVLGIFMLVTGIIFLTPIILAVFEIVVDLIQGTHESDPSIIMFFGIFAFLGAIPAIIGAVFLYKGFRLKKREGLLKDGLMTKMKVTSVENSNPSVNGVPGFYIECSNTEHVKGFLKSYRSEVVYNFECESLEYGTPIDVYVDKIDPTFFYMDVENAIFEAKNKKSMNGEEAELGYLRKGLLGSVSTGVDKDTRNLEYTGNCIYGIIKSIEVDYDTVSFGANPHWLICDVVNEAEQTIYRYTSHKIYSDVLAEVKIGDQIAIYVNPDDPDDYYVNVNEIF